MIQHWISRGEISKANLIALRLACSSSRVCPSIWETWKGKPLLPFQHVIHPQCTNFLCWVKQQLNGSMKTSPSAQCVCVIDSNLLRKWVLNLPMKSIYLYYTTYTCVHLKSNILEYNPSYDSIMTGWHKSTAKTTSKHSKNVLTLLMCWWHIITGKIYFIAK